MHPRHAVAAALVLALAAPAAADLEDALESRWRGAWVVVHGELGSACDGVYTNNEVAGDRIVPKGAILFEPGELARVTKVNVKRQRVDLFLDLAEPVLVPYEDGPFTLYREATCQVQLLVPLGRAVVKGDDLASAEAAVAAVLERHSDRSGAAASTAYNQRVREDYPPDYKETLAEHAAWRAAEHNLLVNRRIDEVQHEATRILDRLPSEPAYLDGFAAGVQVARTRHVSDCDEMVGYDSPLVASWLIKEPPSERRADTPENRQWRQGFEDGQRLTLSLAIAYGLRGCYVPVLPSGT